MTEMHDIPQYFTVKVFIYIKLVYHLESLKNITQGVVSGDIIYDCIVFI